VLRPEKPHLASQATERSRLSQMCARGVVPAKRTFPRVAVRVRRSTRSSTITPADKHPNGRRRLERNPRWTFHFTPTSASWLNAVEGFFATLTKRGLKRGVFRSVADLQAAINRFLAEHNQQSQPFTWTADPDKIIAAVRRGHQILDSIHFVVMLSTVNDQWFCVRQFPLVSRAI
jgi:transposase